MLRVLDLFSGIGGFSLGLERAGMQTVAFCEIDPFCRRVLAKHWPTVPIFEDVRELRGEDVGEIEVICGGFPCQDISLAGRGAGIDGPRSGLWREYDRLLGETRPRYVIVENVTALRGRGLDRVLADLAARGFDAEWDCIPGYYGGAAQPRDRIFIVAYPSGGVGESGGTQRHILGLEGRLLPSRLDPHHDFVEPAIPRVDRGVPNRFHRVSTLGNAVAPGVAEIIGRAILTAEASHPTIGGSQ